MFKKIAIALFALSMLLAGCSAAATSNTDLYESPAFEPAAAPPERQAMGEGAYIDKDVAAYAQDQSAASAERLVIKNANLSIAVDDPLKSMDTISDLAESMGGYVVSAEMYQQQISDGVKVPQVRITIRVPAERLNEAMDAIKAETDLPIITENLTSQDVTAEYTDLNSRLTNLEATERQLQAIMDEATRTEDVLSVYAQLVSIREQIEVIKGQMLYYERSAALSSISVQLLANAAVQPITIAGWQPEGVAREAVQALINTLQSLGDFGIRLVILYIPTLLIIFAPIALVVWGIMKLVNRSRRSRKSVTPEA